MGEDGARTALDARQLVDALHRVSAMMDSLEGRREIRALSREYHSILQRFNDPEQQEDVLEEGELAERLRHAGLTVLSIEDLHAKAAAAATKAPPEKSRGPVVAVSEYRDGSVTDVIRRIEEG